MTAQIQQAIDFARLHRGDCSSIVAFVVLKETGMLEAWLQKESQPEGPRPGNQGNDSDGEDHKDADQLP